MGKIDDASYTFNLCASAYNELPHHTKVINRSCVDSLLWIRLPATVNNGYILLQVDQTLPTTCSVLCHPSLVCHESGKPWISIDTTLLDLAPGQHIYKILMVDRSTNSRTAVYFSYILQDDSPATPYQYMDNERRQLSK